MRTRIVGWAGLFLLLGVLGCQLPQPKLHRAAAHVEVVYSLDPNAVYARVGAVSCLSSGKTLREATVGCENELRNSAHDLGGNLVYVTKKFRSAMCETCMRMKGFAFMGTTSVVSPSTSRRSSTPRKVQKKPEPDGAFGTCFAVNQKGEVLTAAHVVKDAKHVEVALVGGEFSAARVLSKDVDRDLALLSVDKPTPNYLSVADEDGIAVGDWVFTMGFPVVDWLGLEPKFTDGSISATQGLRGHDEVLQMTVPIQPGNSGGPLVNERGQVVGVVVSTAAVSRFFEVTGTLPQGINFAVRPRTGEVWKAAKPGSTQRATQSRREATGRVRAALCAVRTNFHGGSGPPREAAGFELGANEAQLEAACQTAGHNWSPLGKGQAQCSGTPNKLATQAAATIRFCAGKACVVRLNLAQTQKTLETFNAVSRVLEQRYGSYRERRKGGGGCKLVGEEACIKNGAITLIRTWTWPDGHAVQLSIGPDARDRVSVDLTYATPDRNATEGKPRAKPTKKQQSPGFEGL